MNKYLLLLFLFLTAGLCSAQVTKHDEFFEKITFVNGEVTFIKEIEPRSAASFKALKDWGKEAYGKDYFVSSISTDNKKEEINVKSRIELLLPANRDAVSEHVTMQYRINGFISNGKYVLVFSSIKFTVPNPHKDARLKKAITAEDFITQYALDKEDTLQELRVNTKKATLYFFNKLTEDFKIFIGNN